MITTLLISFTSLPSQPPFRSNTCIVIEFKTDGNQERGYAVAEDIGGE